MSGSIGQVLLYGISGIAIMFLIQWKDGPLTLAPLGPSRRKKIEYVFSDMPGICYSPICRECDGPIRSKPATPTVAICQNQGGLYHPGGNGLLPCCIFGGVPKYVCEKTVYVYNKKT